jgi:hypothetical protein
MGAPPPHSGPLRASPHSDLPVAAEKHPGGNQWAFSGSALGHPRHRGRTRHCSTWESPCVARRQLGHNDQPSSSFHLVCRIGGTSTSIASADGIVQGRLHSRSTPRRNLSAAAAAAVVGLVHMCLLRSDRRVKPDPDRVPYRDLPSTGRAIYPLSAWPRAVVTVGFEVAWRSRPRR